MPPVRALRAVWTWGEMIKFSHSLFALPFALLATFLAARTCGGLPSGSQLALIVACMVGARSAAMTFNRIADAEIDARNPRTAMRALPAGRISRGAAWSFFATSCGLFLAGCGGFWMLHGNAWPLLLSPAVLGVVCGYSFTKRFTRWSHVVLGAAIALAPVAAWVAIAPGTLGATAWLLMGAVTFWIGGFDLIYACQDVAFDRAAGLHSVPARLGVPAALWLARGFHAATVVLLLAVGRSASLGVYYHVGVACVTVLLIVENAIVSPKDLSRVNLAFFTINGVVGLVLGALGIVDVVLR